MFRCFPAAERSLPTVSRCLCRSSRAGTASGFKQLVAFDVLLNRRGGAGRDRDGLPNLKFYMCTPSLQIRPPSVQCLRPRRCPSSLAVLADPPAVFANVAKEHADLAGRPPSSDLQTHLSSSKVPAVLADTPTVFGHAHTIDADAPVILVDPPTIIVFVDAQVGCTEISVHTKLYSYGNTSIS
ncbi:hypothetical protein PLICRDRAFT_177788 [Plicaturopsis crispa FD-325 SS-3]|nr:hypothetical protein PLICRDRAFT_177788 [Plicaturopsis crispa FD-325 SS-3]